MVSTFAMEMEDGSIIAAVPTNPHAMSLSAHIAENGSTDGICVADRSTAAKNKRVPATGSIRVIRGNSIRVFALNVDHLRGFLRPGPWIDQVFHRLNEHAPSLGANYMCQRVIILEEDLEIAPDFFGFFAATVPLLDDPNENLLAVSACKSVGRETQKLGNLCCSACGSLRLSQRA